MASITVTFMASASAPMPLYPHYQSQWGFSSLVITVIFGVYALAVLAALLVLGRLSDHVGRRPVLLAAIAIQASTMWLFAHADGLAALLAARVIQGLATGAAIAAVGAGLLDLDKGRGALANAITTPIGTALGGVVAGLFVRLLPAPAELIYLVLGAVMLLQGLALLWMPETTHVRAGALASLRPQFGFSAGIRAPLLRAAPVIVATWAVVGFLASLSPAIVKQLQGTNSALLSGLAMFVTAGSGGVAILVLQKCAPRDAMRIGAQALVAGVLVIVAGLALHSTALFFTGLSITGVGFGTGFQGAVRSVVSQAQVNERAGVLSVIFVIAYLSMGLPAMGAGYLLSQGGNLSSVTTGFGAVIAVLALLPLTPPLRWPAAFRGAPLTSIRRTL
jgi:predicted MFS family arabinose efflux permease